MRFTIDDKQKWIFFLNTVYMYAMCTVCDVECLCHGNV